MKYWKFVVLIASFGTMNYAAEAQLQKVEELKMAVSLGDQVRMAYDQTERTSLGQVNSSFSHSDDLLQLNKADFYLYKGSDRAALRLYHGVLESFVPHVSDGKDARTIDVFMISKSQDHRFTESERILKKIPSDAPLSSEQWMFLARAANTLAIYNHSIGNYEVAEKLYLRALQVRGTYSSKTSEHYVSCLHNLAVLRKDQGRYNAADDIMNYVAKYYAQKKSEKSSEYAMVKNNHAMLLNEMGRQKEAMAMLSALVSDMDNISFPSWSFDPSRLQTNYALLLLEQDRVDEAESLLRSALEAYKSAGKLDDPDYLQINLYLGEVYLSTGNVGALEGLLESLLNGLDKIYGSQSLPYARALELQADFQKENANYQEAYATYQKIADIRKSKLGALHKSYLSVINKQGECAWQLGQLRPAFDKFKEASDGYLLVINKFFLNMSEKEKTRFWMATMPALDVLYSFVSQDGRQVEGALAYAYQVRLQTKGLLLQNSNQVIRQVNSSEDAEIKKQYQEWVAIKQDLSNYYSMSPATIADMEIDLAQLEADANELEKAVNLKVSGQINAESRLVSFQDVSSNLQPDEVAVEIIRLSHSVAGKSGEYGAWIVRDGRLQFENIGSASMLETRMIKYYKNAVRLKWKDSLSYDAFWKPLAAETAGTSRVYVSLDGVYNLLNLNSLMTNGQYLLDRRQIEIIPNSAVLVSNKTSNHSIDQGVLIGNPVFGSSKIAPLPGTATEIETIDELLNQKQINTRFYEQTQATENALKQVSNPAILHIATHGFFMGDKGSNEGNVASRTLRSANPLMRSGLLLAGAGQQDEPSVENPSDGVFTAYDAMNMNLNDTELVVLSACETGTGEVVNGEGVYGLSRAFSVAGAKHLVMSLWKVDDQATMKLMSTFYKNWLGGEEIKTAFNQAQKAVKEEYEDPYYWAAFVMVNNE